MQNSDLLAYYAPDNKEWFNKHRQIGQVLDQLLNARLELRRAGHSDLETEVA
jgi:hypothetical protein